MSGAAVQSERGHVSYELMPEAWTHYCCPRCHAPLRRDDAQGASCQQITCALHARGSFPVIDNRPVLIDFDNSVVDRDEIVRAAGASVIPRDPHPLIAAMRSLAAGSDNRVAARNFEAFHAELMRLARGNRKPLMLVIGGGHIGSHLETAYERDDIDILCFDIYKSDLTDFVADAHQIPLVDRCVDGIWIQAVLEHVLSPDQVVAEIHRVLGPEGIVYAETPFMQQVHEGAYDFTRYTRSGHRWLFRNFEEISSGVVAGAGTSLLWSIKHFFRNLTGSNQIGTAVAAACFWLSYFDRFGQRVDSDAANGHYFLGRKSATPLSPKEMIRYYRDCRNAPGKMAE